VARFTLSAGAARHRPSPDTGAALHHDVHALQEREVAQHIALDGDDIGILSRADGADAQARFGPITVDVVGRDAFIRNKSATGRARDLADIEDLGE
jgi:hypothetical protein